MTWTSPLLVVLSILGFSLAVGAVICSRPTLVRFLDEYSTPMFWIGILLSGFSLAIYADRDLKK